MEGTTVKLVIVFCHAIAVTVLLCAWLLFSDLLSIKGPQVSPNTKSEQREQVLPWHMGIAF